MHFPSRGIDTILGEAAVRIDLSATIKGSTHKGKTFFCLFTLNNEITKFISILALKFEQIYLTVDVSKIYWISGKQCRP